VSSWAAAQAKQRQAREAEARAEEAREAEARAASPARLYRANSHADGAEPDHYPTTSSYLTGADRTAEDEEEHSRWPRPAGGAAPRLSAAGNSGGLSGRLSSGLSSGSSRRSVFAEAAEANTPARKPAKRVSWSAAAESGQSRESSARFSLGGTASAARKGAVPATDTEATELDATGRSGSPSAAHHDATGTILKEGASHSAILSPGSSPMSPGKARQHAWAQPAIAEDDEDVASAYYEDVRQRGMNRRRSSSEWSETVCVI